MSWVTFWKPGRWSAQGCGGRSSGLTPGSATLTAWPWANAHLSVFNFHVGGVRTSPFLIWFALWIKWYLRLSLKHYTKLYNWKVLLEITEKLLSRPVTGRGSGASARGAESPSGRWGPPPPSSQRPSTPPPRARRWQPKQSRRGRTCAVLHASFKHQLCKAALGN